MDCTIGRGFHPAPKTYLFLLLLSYYTLPAALCQQVFKTIAAVFFYILNIFVALKIVDF